MKRKEGKATTAANAAEQRLRSIVEDILNDSSRGAEGEASPEMPADSDYSGQQRARALVDQLLGVHGEEWMTRTLVRLIKLIGADAGPKGNAADAALAQAFTWSGSFMASLDAFVEACESETESS